MRVLLDECAPRKLRQELPGHDVRTIGEMGWAGIKNGPLLERTAGQFDVFLTVDQRLATPADDGKRRHRASRWERRFEVRNTSGAGWVGSYW